MPRESREKLLHHGETAQSAWPGRSCGSLLIVAITAGAGWATFVQPRGPGHRWPAIVLAVVAALGAAKL